jgi:hypothetical protein
MIQNETVSGKFINYHLILIGLCLCGFLYPLNTLAQVPRVNVGADAARHAVSAVQRSLQNQATQRAIRSANAANSQKPPPPALSNSPLTTTVLSGQTLPAGNRKMSKFTKRLIKKYKASGATEQQIGEFTAEAKSFGSQFKKKFSGTCAPSSTPGYTMVCTTKKGVQMAYKYLTPEMVAKKVKHMSSTPVAVAGIDPSQTAGTSPVDNSTQVYMAGYSSYVTSNSNQLNSMSNQGNSGQTGFMDPSQGSSRSPASSAGSSGSAGVR